MQTLYTKGQSFRWMRLLTLLLLLLPLAGRAQVVISQVYGGGGGGSGSPTYTRDFVELFNRGAIAVDISNYNIQYASATGTNYSPNAVTATPGTAINLQPGQYYTVVLGGTGTAGATLVQGTGAGQADYVRATAGSSISNSAGKIALTSNSTALVGTAASTPPVSGALVDFVGFGTTASAYEGTAAASAPTSVQTALLRANNGCTDSNNNAADFANAAPVVRNQSTTLAPCGAGPTPAEINVKQGATTYLTASTYNGFSSTTIGSSDAKTFTIENLGGTVLDISSIAATGDFSVSGAPTTVAANGTADVTVTFTPTAAGTRTGTLTINSDDADEAAYVINLSATATATTPNPMIAVSQAGTPYADASTYSGFANTVVGSTSPAVTFTITNSSTTDALTISGIATTGNFAVSGTVPTTVAANSTATFALTFTPTAGGTRTGTVTIANNSQGTPSYVINLSGIGTVPAPTLTDIDPTNPAGGATYDFTLMGTGFGTIANTTVSFNGMSVVPTSVNGAGTSLVVALPLPAAGGTFPITVTTPNGTSGPQSLTVTAAPAGFFEPFEPGSLGTAYPTTATAVTLRTGSYDFLQTVLGILPNDKYNNTQSARLRGGGSITMGFDKTGGAGVVTISAALYGNETGPGLAVEYSTDGGTLFTPAPGSPATLTNTLTPYTFTLNVAGPVRLRLSTTNLATGGNPRINVDDLQIADYTAAVCDAPTGLTAGSITSNSASVSFTASASATGYTVTTMPVTTTQTLAAGATSVAFSGLNPGTAYTVSIVSNCAAGATSSAATVNFTTLAAAPTLAVTQAGTSYSSGGTAYSFGNQTVGTTSGAVSFTLTNNGPDALTITGINSSGDYNLSGTVPTTVAAGSTATVSVTFTPTATGTRNGTLVVNSNATAGTNYTVNLTGNGLAAPTATLAVSQGSTSYANNGSAYSFGNQTVGTTSSPVAFTLTNNGNSAVTISGITTTNDFAISGAVPTTIAANSTATVSVTFTPTVAGTRPGTLVVSSNATNAPTYTVNLTGNGQAAVLPDLVVNTGTPASPTPIMGNYNNVTIASGGYAALAGPLTVAGALNIQSGGGLLQGGLGQPCQLLTGTGSFNLQAGGTLAVCDPAGISPTGVPTGAVLLTGTRTYSPLAQYIYSGNAAQVTGLGLPTTVLALGVQNAAGVTLSQALSLTQGLNLNLGNLTTNGRNFTLLSSSTGTAGVVNVGGVVVGVAIVQRYINSTNAIGYRHYAAPVSNTIMADLSAPGFSPVFNSAYNSSATPGAVTPFPTVFGYNQSRVGTATSTYGPFDQGWFSPSLNDAMVPGKGYTVNAPNTVLIDLVGNLNNGPVASGILSRGADAAAGWHLLGNPYPSPLDWSTVAAGQRPGMDAAIYVFESAGQYGGSYRASVNGVGGNANSPQPIVVSSQGYFVRVASGQASGEVNLTNANRVTTFDPQPSFGRGTADARPQVALTLQGASVADAAYVYFQAGATAGKDVEFDATKLPNSHGLNLTSLAGGEALAINGLPTLGTATVLVPLNVAAPQAGSYSLTAGSLANLTGTTVTLIDALTSTRTVLTAGTAYAFSLSGTSATGRFTLEFRPTGALATTAAQTLAAQLQVFPNPTSGSFRVQLPLLSRKAAVSATLLNALGQTVLSRSLSVAAGQGLDAEFDVRGLAAGVYTLRLNVDGTPVTRKVVVE